MKTLRASMGFTLIELLVVIAVIAILAMIAMPVLQSVKVRGYQTGALSNIRQIGAATLVFAAEHDYQIPGRTETGGGDKWPAALQQYVQDVRVFAAPGDPKNFINRKVDPLSNNPNNTSFIMNGYNDLGAYSDPSVEIRMNRIENPSMTILFGTPKTGSGQFYMDFEEPPHGNQTDVLNLEMYNGGSNYVFADGSARFISKKEYQQIDSDHAATGEGWLWKVNKDYATPKF